VLAVGGLLEQCEVWLKRCEVWWNSVRCGASSVRFGGRVWCLVQAE